MDYISGLRATPSDFAAQLLWILAIPFLGVGRSVYRAWQGRQVQASSGHKMPFAIGVILGIMVVSPAFLFPAWFEEGRRTREYFERLNEQQINYLEQQGIDARAIQERTLEQMGIPKEFR